jgi:tetratricopeptide (TPR) repeat protein
MNTMRGESVKDLLHQALERSPDERGPFLDEACRSDPSLRAELDSLLSASEDVRSSFMQSPPVGDGMMVEIDSCTALEPGQIFAQRFQLVRKLGEGGMGQVWLADQTSPVRRQVALKLIKAGMYDEAVVQRFQSERQSLAIMDHPAIAKVFDAGATGQGQPYFVMEYVPGMPITEYCDQKKLTIKQRLELFIHACEGVQHAHQKAVIHRDLKPANILVVEVDGKPAPRIIDFGLAKPTTARIDGESLFTEVGSFVGTPGYMSPEQADPGGQDVDTRTDVYSLGVVLYVLLTGTLPLDLNQRDQSLAEVLRKLREEEPPRPSTKVSTDRQSSTGTAQARGTEPAQLVSLLRGDLDWIAIKALEKDRARRYGTPSELAADLQRYLNHEPVIARPARTGYRLQRYLRRHRVGVAVAAVLILLLAGFAALQAVQLRRITRERDRATRITDFMTGMFKVSDPSEARGNTVTAREILDKASNELETGLAKDPEVQAQMMQVMATTHENLGLYSHADNLAKRALHARQRLLGPDDPKTLESMTQLGGILEDEGRYPEAEKLENQALAAEQRVLGPEAPLTIQTIDTIAVILEDEGHYDKAEKLDRQVIELESRKMGPDDPRTLRSMNHLGILLSDDGRYGDAEKEFRSLLDVSRRVLGPDHPQTLRAIANLGSALHMQGRLAEAEPLYRQLLSTDQRVLGPEHHELVVDMENLASLLSAENHLVEAEKLYREALEISSKTVGPEHPATLELTTNLAKTLFDEGHIPDAERLERKTIEVDVRVLGPENPDTLWAQCDLAKILNREGRYPEAEKLAQKTFAIQLRTLGSQHPDTLATLRQLGIAMAATQRYAEASNLFRDALKESDGTSGQGNRWTPWYYFASVAAEAGRSNDALDYLREAIHRGFQDANGLETSYDLKSLRNNPHFQELVAQLRQQSATVPAH